MNWKMLEGTWYLGILQRAMPKNSKRLFLPQVEDLNYLTMPYLSLGNGGLVFGIKLWKLIKFVQKKF